MTTMEEARRLVESGALDLLPEDSNLTEEQRLACRDYVDQRLRATEGPKFRWARLDKREKDLDRLRRWRAKCPGYARVWRMSNEEHVKAWRAAYYLRNKDKIKVRNHAYYLRTSDQAKERVKMRRAKLKARRAAG
jgi:hypothetical protein